MTPAGIANRSTGAADAVWTSATSSGDPSSWTSSHWAPTVCIQLPMLLTMDASHTRRKMGTASGANPAFHPMRAGAALTCASAMGRDLLEDTSDELHDLRSVALSDQ